ncbi:endonuclease/exonuclease/phosphatase family protein [Metamycoplasma auris]|uniref:Endonuclease/exonuclease/phosphatase family protein n=1 Tax=Metamycoplasma auris TaxID=51363 RepID=A0A2W7G8Z8_9BACT|nr:endonuclease/exonuclease/phosphatase family protein [Metamycoplasma auris]PZW01525.1 hypothetical protein BCF89_10145 [Metamycoplasma auris]
MKAKRNILLLISTTLVAPSFLIAASCQKKNSSDTNKNEESYNLRLTELIENISSIEDKNIKEQFNSSALSIIQSKDSTPILESLNKIELLLKDIKKAIENNNKSETEVRPQLTPIPAPQSSMKPEPKPQPQPEPKPQHQPRSQDIPAGKENTFKWGHWNILKYHGDGSQDKKTKRIALLSEKEKFDILGLTEVFNPDNVKNIVDEMNKLSSSNMYSYIASKNEKGDKFSKGSAEAVAIIYNNKKFEPIKFNNDQIGYSYKDKFDDNLGDKSAQYARPPYGIQFKYKLNQDKKMTFVFDHFDGPGWKKKYLGEKPIDKIGSFEYREGKQLWKALDRFDELGGNAGNVFFAGDTNIKLGKEHLVFDWLDKYNRNSGYKSVFEDNKKYSSSLNMTGGFANPYDKMFYKSNFKLTNSFVFDIYKVVKDDEYVNLFKKHDVEIDNEKAIRHQSILSDHTYTVAEFEIQ